jgi:nucleoside 2-deoxyribosyltransferase
VKRIFLICSVRGASEEVLRDQLRYVSDQEAAGNTVHYPPRDTNQAATGFDICWQNLEAIESADEVHVFYSPDSQGTHFDMGMAFALGKPVKIAHSVPYGPGKSYARMLDEWTQ